MNKQDLVKELVRYWYPPNDRHQHALYIKAISQAIECHESLIRSYLRDLKAKAGRAGIAAYLNREIEEMGDDFDDLVLYDAISTVVNSRRYGDAESIKAIRDLERTLYSDGVGKINPAYITVKRYFETFADLQGKPHEVLAIEFYNEIEATDRFIENMVDTLDLIDLSTGKFYEGRGECNHVRPGITFPSELSESQTRAVCLRLFETEEIVRPAYRLFLNRIKESQNR